MRKSLSDVPTRSDSGAPRQGSMGLTIFADIADTTWRLFVPTLSLLLLGRHLDVRYHTKPWLMLLGVSIGGLLAGLLIRQQLIRGAS